MRFKQDKVDTKLPLGPMIDAVFLLLCFFLVTTDFTPPEGLIDSPLPKDLGYSAATEVPRDTVEARIRVDRVGGHNTFYLNNAPMTPQELLQNLIQIQRQSEDVVAIIDPSARVHFQGVVDAYSIARDAQIARVLFPTRALQQRD